MNFTLIICTYKRPQALLTLLKSVCNQTLYPTEILIVDGSLDDDTKSMLQERAFKNVAYYKVDQDNRGLTKQRNFGISKVSNDSEIVCFLDDDIILDSKYFEELLKTYTLNPDALGVGGYITNEVAWQLSDKRNNPSFFYYDGWMRKEPLRFKVRTKLGLSPDTPPCFLPTFSHGRSVGFLPPSGKIYNVEQFMGGVSSYRKEIFNTIKFSSYFEGYGLYEDTDFCLRLAKKGTLYVNTSAQCEHYHEPIGRPNKIKYGTMVVRNGWYVWRIKYKTPSLKAKFKWHATALVLMGLTLFGVFYSKRKQEAFYETIGRFKGWCSLLFNKPKVQL